MASQIEEVTVPISFFLGSLPPRQLPVDSETWMPWLAVLGAWLCFGSFAVPMKARSVVQAEVHPLIFQTYKTFWTFVTSLAVLLFLPFEFTWWGILSGFSWVPAGIAAVIAVQNVGIACGQAIWQVTIIGTSFVWGFVLLHDTRVYDWVGTALALASLTLGVLGMTAAFNLNLTSGMASKSSKGGVSHEDTPLLRHAKSAPHGVAAQDMLIVAAERRASKSDIRFSVADIVAPSPAVSRVSSIESSSEDESLLDDGAPQVSYTLGVAAAIFNGVWGGANLVPSHFSSIQGVHYVISFGIGAVVANVVLLAAFFCQRRCAGVAMPGLELRVMMVPGFVSGVLWSMGNFCSLYAVASLGQGIGYSLVQASIIVSGLWGILYYQEMQGRPIIYWVLACAVCGLGVAGLAMERVPPL